MWKPCNTIKLNKSYLYDTMSKSEATINNGRIENDFIFEGLPLVERMSSHLTLGDKNPSPFHHLPPAQETLIHFPHHLYIREKFQFAIMKSIFFVNVHFSFHSLLIFDNIFAASPQLNC